MKNIIFTLSLLFVSSMCFAQIKVIASGDVGVGTTSPSSKLHVDNGAGIIGVAPPQIDKFNVNGSEFNYAGFGSTVYRIASFRDGTNTNAFYIENFKESGSIKETCLFRSGYNNNANFGIATRNGGQNVIRFMVRNNGRIGIKTISPSYDLEVNGSAAKPGGGMWSTASDKRLKKNIHQYEKGLDEILKLKPVEFQYNGKGGILDTEKTHVGLIAQDYQEVLPEAVESIQRGEILREGEGEEYYEKVVGYGDYLSIDPSPILYMLVNATKEQQAIIDDQNEYIEDLESRLSKIEKLLLQNDDPESVQHIQIPETSSAENIVFQNVPNPTEGTTIINYKLQKGTQSAKLIVSDLNGKVIYSERISPSVNGSIVLDIENLANGTYMYSLEADGELIGTKRMVVAR